MKIRFSSLFLFALMLSLMLGAAFLIGCGDDDDDDEDDNGGDDDDDDDCEAEDICEGMVATSFFQDLETCLTWFEEDGETECTDFDAFYDCGCDCAGKAPVDFEPCMGVCNSDYCYTEN